MSKRASSAPAIRPTKLVKLADIWNNIPDAEEKSKEFKPIETGPKTKVQKTFVLNYSPKVEASISLNGCYPEVRFTSPDGCFYMSGEEFLCMSGQGIKILDCVRLEATEEGYRLARYNRTESGMPDLDPIAVLEMNKHAAKRLKAKLELMCEHVCAIRDSEATVRLMFESVCDVYREEYRRLNTSAPIADLFMELARIVETYVPHVIIVKSFLDKMHESRLLSYFNHYNLCAITASQKSFLLDMLK